MVTTMNNWNINPDSLLKIPGDVWVFWKTKDGIYLGCNDNMAEDLQLSSRKEVEGRSDFDFANLTHASANEFREGDQIVITSREVRNFTEPAILQDRIEEFHTIKMPLIEGNSTIIGVLGISYKQTTELDRLLSKLTNRENEVALLLIRGYNTKEIARDLDISPRTIECHVNNIKNKLQVYNQKKLIRKLLDKYLRAI